MLQVHWLLNPIDFAWIKRTKFKLRCQGHHRDWILSNIAPQWRQQIHFSCANQPQFLDTVHTIRASTLIWSRSILLRESYSANWVTWHWQENFFPVHNLLTILLTMYHHVCNCVGTYSVIIRDFSSESMMRLICIPSSVRLSHLCV